MLLFSREVHLHQNQDRKPIHTVSITTDTGKTVAQTHTGALSEFTTSNHLRNRRFII